MERDLLERLLEFKHEPLNSSIITGIMIDYIMTNRDKHKYESNDSACGITVKLFYTFVYVGNTEAIELTSWMTNNTLIAIMDTFHDYDSTSICEFKAYYCSDEIRELVLQERISYPRYRTGWLIRQCKPYEGDITLARLLPNTTKSARNNY